jgi:hypothetical protein
MKKMSGVTKKKQKKLSTNFNSVRWQCCMMFACQFDNNLFALLLFEGICHSNSKYESISLQRATLGIELLQRAGLGAVTKRVKK